MKPVDFIGFPFRRGLARAPDAAVDFAPFRFGRTSRSSALNDQRLGKWRRKPLQSLKTDSGK
jgi:hypothetical protein